MSTYQEVYAQWQSDPEGFWMNAAKAIDWDKTPSKALFDLGNNLYEWFSDGMVNTCYNAVDRHVEAGKGDQVAIIYDSPITGAKDKITFAELQDKVARLAGGLAAKGVTKGDRVIIYMPMVPEAIVAMLATVRIGAVHSVVFGGFASNELATRINDAQPKAIIAGSCGLEPNRTVPYKPLLDGAIELSTHKPDFTVILQRDALAAEMKDGYDFDWNDICAADPVDCVPVEGNHPAYVLYTSGTTGQPKGVIRHTGGHLVALNWTMKNVYNVDPGDVFWAASDVGWVVGHSYICYAPLIHGNTTIVFEGKPVGTPDPGTFWRVISEHKVRSFFTAPTAFRAIKREDPKGEYKKKYDLSCLRALYLAGERGDPDTINWAKDLLGIPVIDHWWQTELGYPAVANPVGIELLETKLGSPAVPMPGYDIHVLHDDGNRCEAGEEGAICIRLPLPPGTLPTLWNAEARYEASYLSEHPGYYLTGDGGRYDEDGYLFVMGRIDDVINVAGHRMSTGAIEEVLATPPAVAECAVIGVPDEIKGQAPRGLVVVKSGASTDGLAEELVRLVRDEIGAVAAFRLVDVVPALPKTRSGKILRKTLRGIAAGRDEPVPSTIEDPGVLDTLAPILRS